MGMDWQRAFTNTLARLILAYGLAALAFGQTPAPKQEPSTQPNLPALAQPATPSQTTPAHLAGVEVDKIVRWTLKDAIMAALEKNPTSRSPGIMCGFRSSTFWRRRGLTTR